MNRKVFVVKNLNILDSFVKIELKICYFDKIY